MANRVDITPDMCRQLLRYEPDTGRLFWRERTPDMMLPSPRSAEWRCRNWNVAHAGKEAFLKLHRGRLYGTIFNVRFFAHRVIWAITQGSWPEDQIDHINGDPLDNRIVNLRAVSHLENQRNMKLRSTNVSGANGVNWSKQTGKWSVKIRDGKRYLSLGHYADLAEAVAVRRRAEAEIGYHPNHGRRS